MRTVECTFVALLASCTTAPPPDTAATPVASAASTGMPDAAALALADASLPMLEITLERTVCYGVCPAYKVTLRQDGTVVYEGDKYVKVHGTVTSQVAPADVLALGRRFDAASFDSLSVPEPCPRGEMTDMPTNRLTVARAGSTHTVKHYLGNMCAPKVLADLADAVDKIAATDRWIRCGAGPHAYCDKP